jgi:hypothetical protein
MFSTKSLKLQEVVSIIEQNFAASVKEQDWILGHLRASVAIHLLVAGPGSEVSITEVGKLP